MFKAKKGHRKLKKGKTKSQWQAIRVTLDSSIDFERKKGID